MGAVADPSVLPRLPSPLIKPDVRISRIRLSDWFHCRHTAGCRYERPPYPHPALAPQYSSFGKLLVSCGVCRLAPIHRPAPSSPSTPEVRVLPSTGIARLQQYYNPVRLPPVPRPEAALRPLPSPQMGLPRYPHHLSGVPCPLPRRIKTGACVDCFPAHAAFPVMPAGRHPHLYFRGLLRLHSRYGPSDCSTAQGGLCHEASIQPVTQPNRSSATRAIDNSLGGSSLHW